jgi:putative transposase
MGDWPSIMRSECLNTDRIEQTVEAFVEHYNHCSHHESLSNVTPADVYFGRYQDILSERIQTKEKTMKQRHLINHGHAA